MGTSGLVTPLAGTNDENSGTDAFNMTEVHGCFMALSSVLEERKRVMDRRAARDNGLIERGNWVGLQRAMEASKVKFTYPTCVLGLRGDAILLPPAPKTNLSRLFVIRRKFIEIRSSAYQCSSTGSKMPTARRPQRVAREGEMFAPPQAECTTQQLRHRQHRRMALHLWARLRAPRQRGLTATVTWFGESLTWASG